MSEGQDNGVDMKEFSQQLGDIAQAVGIPPELIKMAQGLMENIGQFAESGKDTPELTAANGKGVTQDIGR